jgi:hypothetical protein
MSRGCRGAFKMRPHFFPLPTSPRRAGSGIVSVMAIFRQLSLSATANPVAFIDLRVSPT